MTEQQAFGRTLRRTLGGPERIPRFSMWRRGCGGRGGLVSNSPDAAVAPADVQSSARAAEARARRVATVMALAAVAFQAGAALAYFYDPDRGARRRALVRDRSRHSLRIAARQSGRVGLRLQGTISGMVHALRRRLPGYQHAAPDLDAYLKQRVESELGHDRELPLSDLNIDAVGGVVHLRGTVADAALAERLVRRVAANESVRAVMSLLRTPAGVPVGGTAGDLELLSTPAAERQGKAIEARVLERWPNLRADDLHEGGGHVERLAQTIAYKTGEPEPDVRTQLDAILLATAEGNGG